MIYSVLDFETTGLGPRESRVLEVGITKITGAGEILDSYETLINPDNEPVGATHIHGITREMVAKAPTFREIAAEILNYIDGTVLTAHNAPFDIPFLREELIRAEKPHNPIPSLCTLKLSRRHIKEIRSHSLSALCEYLGITNSLSHSAAADAFAAAQLLAYMLKEYAVAETVSPELVFRKNEPDPLFEMFEQNEPTEKGRTWTREDFRQEREFKDQRLSRDMGMSEDELISAYRIPGDGDGDRDRDGYRDEVNFSETRSARKPAIRRTLEAAENGLSYTANQVVREIDQLELLYKTAEGQSVRINQSARQKSSREITLLMTYIANSYWFDDAYMNRDIDFSRAYIEGYSLNQLGSILTWCCFGEFGKLGKPRELGKLGGDRAGFRSSFEQASRSGHWNQVVKAEIIPRVIRRAREIIAEKGWE